MKLSKEDISFLILFLLVILIGSVAIIIGLGHPHWFFIYVFLGISTLIFLIYIVISERES
jgi:hypothetical protein